VMAFTFAFAGWRVPAANRLRPKARLRRHVHTEEREGRVPHQVHQALPDVRSDSPVHWLLRIHTRSSHSNSNAHPSHTQMWPSRSAVMPATCRERQCGVPAYLDWVPRLSQRDLDLPRAGHPADHAGRVLRHGALRMGQGGHQRPGAAPLRDCFDSPSILLVFLGSAVCACFAPVSHMTLDGGFATHHGHAADLVLLSDVWRNEVIARAIPFCLCRSRRSALRT